MSFCTECGDYDLGARNITRYCAVYSRRLWRDAWVVLLIPHQGQKPQFPRKGRGDSGVDPGDYRLEPGSKWTSLLEDESIWHQGRCSLNSCYKYGNRNKHGNKNHEELLHVSAGRVFSRLSRIDEVARSVMELASTCLFLSSARSPSEVRTAGFVQCVCLSAPYGELGGNHPTAKLAWWNRGAWRSLLVCPQIRHSTSRKLFP